MPTTSRQEQIQMNDDVEVWTMEFQAHVTIILYRNRLGSSFPKCLWKMEDLFNNHADHSCDSWMVPVLNPGVQFNGIIGLCKKNIFIYIYIQYTYECTVHAGAKRFAWLVWNFHFPVRLKYWKLQDH